MRKPLLRTVRARLTVWYVVVAAAFLGTFGAITYGLLLRTLQRRMDASLQLAVDSFANALTVELHEAADRAALERLMAEEVLELPIPDRAMVVFREDGSVVTAGLSLRTHAMDLQIERIRRAPGGFSTLDKDTNNAQRLFATNLRLGGVPFHVVVARRLRDQLAFLDAVRTTLLIGIPLCVACAGILGWWIVGKALNPVLAMSSQAASIGAADLTQRLPVQDAEDELGRLAVTFNDLLGRLTTVLDQQRRFMADASHELRTPVAVVRTEAEVALSRVRPAEELRRSLRVIQQESALLTSILDDLMLLARADARHAVLAASAFDLDELVARTVDSFRAVAEKKRIALATKLLAESQITADERLIRRLLMNLVDNALKYTPAGGRVLVELRRQDDGYAILVSDSGTPVAAAERERIFNRFDRGSAPDVDGAGLGLPIAQGIAALHGGRVTLVPGAGGNTFAVYLPFTSVRA